MGNKFIDDARAKLAGRTKRELIEGMLVHSPHQTATEKTIIALEAFPLYLLMLAHDFPTKVWILDRGEKPSSAEILNDAARRRRWHSTRICIDDCDGVTESIDGYVAVVVSWKTLLAMRHEFAHALTTFFSRSTRQKLTRLYEEARQKNAFTEPLAAESLGEYAACALSYYYFPDLQAELREFDPGLFDVMQEILRQAEEISQLISESAAVPTP